MSNHLSGYSSKPCNGGRSFQTMLWSVDGWRIDETLPQARTRRPVRSGEALAESLGVQSTATKVIRRPGCGTVVVSRLEGTASTPGKYAAIQPQTAYVLLLTFRDLPREALHVAGRDLHDGPSPAGALRAFSLTDGPTVAVKGYLDALHFHVPHDFLAALAEERGLPLPTGLVRSPSEPDPVALDLGTLIAPAMLDPDPAADLFVESLAMALLAHVVKAGGQTQPHASPSRNGLAPWQERKAKELMRARFATPLTMTEVSETCRLSTSYFAAAFRRSTGQSPHRYLSQLRVEEAKRLMLAGKTSLAEVGLACGFGDQSYFTRVFSNLVGTSPGQWRRANTYSTLQNEESPAELRFAD